MEAEQVQIRVTQDREIIVSGGRNAAVNATKELLVTLGVVPPAQAPGGQPQQEGPAVGGQPQEEQQDPAVQAQQEANQPEQEEQQAPVPQLIGGRWTCGVQGCNMSSRYKGNVRKHQQHMHQE